MNPCSFRLANEHGSTRMNIIDHMSGISGSWCSSWYSIGVEYKTVDKRYIAENASFFRYNMVSRHKLGQNLGDLKHVMAQVLSTLVSPIPSGYVTLHCSNLGLKINHDFKFRFFFISHS